MKKTLRSLKLACLAAVSMLVVSCGGSADYRNFLPADSFMTMSVNPASLLQKSDAGDIGQHTAPDIRGLHRAIHRHEEEQVFFLT